MAKIARRNRWRNQNLAIVLAGGKPSKEPNWDLDQARVSRTHEAEFQAMKAEYEAQNRDPEGRKFPGTL